MCVFFFKSPIPPDSSSIIQPPPPLGPTWSTEEGELQRSKSQRAMQLLPGPQWFQPRRRFERTTSVSREVGGISLEIYWGSWEKPTKKWGVNVDMMILAAIFGLKITNLQLPQINFDFLMEVCLLKQPGKIHHVIPRFFLSNVGGWVLQKIEEISGKIWWWKENGCHFYCNFCVYRFRWGFWIPDRFSSSR